VSEEFLRHEGAEIDPLDGVPSPSIASDR
jgi:hypothetical protein